MRRLAAALVAVLLLAASAAAAAFTLRSEVDARRIGVDDQLVLTITLEGTGFPENVALPLLTNLEVLAGPSQSTQISIVNGSMSQERAYTYVLRPRGVGRAEVGVVRAGEQTAPAIAIEVVSGSIRPRQERQRPDPFGADPFADPFEEFFGRSRGRGAPAPGLLMQATPSRTRLRVGEPLVLTYALLTQTSVADLQMKDAPQYGGFWVEDLERPNPGASGEPASVGGESYRRFPLIRKLLFPTRAGTLTLPPASFRITLARQGFFDAGGVVERATKPVTITVDPLPEEPGFSGAVGRFSASAAIDRETVALGEAATLRFRVEGTGNLKWVERGPELEVPGARVYPPQLKSELRTAADGITGSRTWEFVLIPETSGTLEVPPLSFSYFDPAAVRIVTARTAPLSLRVLGGTAAANRPQPAADSRQASGALPLRAELERPASAALAIAGRALLGLVALVLAAHVALWGASRVGGLRGHMAASGGRTRSARSALRELERAAGNGLTKEQAAALVERALHEAFGELRADDDSERARALRALLDEVHFVRYAPQLGDYADKIRDLASRGAEAVRRWA